MRINFIKAANAYALVTSIAAERPKIVFESAKLYLRKIKPHPQILGNIAANLSRDAIVHYPIARNVTIPAAAGILDISREQLFYGRIPKILVLAMVDNDAASGLYAKNPFNFKHFNVKHLDLRIDGQSPCCL